MDALIELSKIIILAVMAGIAVYALKISHKLKALTSPLARRLAELHQINPAAMSLEDPWLSRIKQRYESLISHVDNVDAAEFSAGEIATMPLVIFGKSMTASAAQSWLRQSPGILISLGLLGTFFGLTIGLGQINGILTKEATPSQTMTALSAIVAPMGTAFQTSLIGLFLSLVVLIWSQANGTRNCLERCELLLSSWLETVLPQYLGSKVMTPLRQSIEDLNSTVKILPETLQQAIQESMRKAFADKLDQVFDANTELAAQAQASVRQMSAISSSLNESGQDFVRAAQVLRHSNFASTLHESVQGLLASREFLTASTEGLSTRLVEVRESLLATQSQWKVLAKTAEKELESCRLASEQMQAGAASLTVASQKLEEGTQVTAEATKQLREARLEVMRDRKLAIEVAESVRDRLATDSSVAESCQAFASALEICLVNWSHNIEMLDTLQNEIVKNSLQARQEDMQFLEEKKNEAKAAIEEIRGKLLDDLGQAISLQQESVGRLDGSTRGAQILTEQLMQQLDALRTSIADLNLGLR
jgi:hypothetical protein